MSDSFSTSRLSDTDLMELTIFAEQLADAASAISMQYFRAPIDIDYKIKGDDHFDPVTIADRGAEQAIRKCIEAKYPDHSILGEEFPAKVTDSPFQWVLDPIDGTRAFISGLPTWGTLIGLTYHGEPIIGVIEQPYLQERYVGSPLGSTLNGTVIRTRPCTNLAAATVCTTDQDLFSTRDKARFKKLLQETRLVRYGLDCYAYAILSLGYMDIVAETGLKPYDMVALIPIVRGAGGECYSWRSDSRAGFDDTLVAISDPAIAESVLAILQS